jgi:dephospho-CoA kinase
MIIVGLTGGIASGKSSAADFFAELGAYRIDADQLARRAVEPGQPAYDAVVRYFGKQILADDGYLERKKLAAIVFADSAQREMLNTITHPPVRNLLREELSRARDYGAEVALVEVPLLYEAGFDREVDRVVVVSVSPEKQLWRLMQRDKLSREEAEQRIASQMPLAEKEARADFVIDNNGTLEDAKKQVLAIWQQLGQECAND